MAILAYGFELRTLHLAFENAEAQFGACVVKLIPQRVALAPQGAIF
ncbi:hypothetical protein [Bradyrhizobium iriomotense]|nr:hypothetical protein [Bradyrhizobium iriomotense]MBR1128414.1 hypothetical protein [Bradyrhizobium iriomotense]